MLDPGVVGGSVPCAAPYARSMLRHLTPAGTRRLSEIDCRQPASECPGNCLAAGKPFRQTGMAVLIRNLCALTIGRAGWQKDQLAAFLIIPQF